MKITPLFCFLLLTSCSMYKSNGRKQLESDAASGKGQVFSQSCGPSEAPSRAYEIVVSEPDLEILKTALPDGQVLVVATQTDDGRKTSCRYTFATERAWQSHQTEFIAELENNMMTSE